MNAKNIEINQSDQKEYSNEIMLKGINLFKKYKAGIFCFNKKDHIVLNNLNINVKKAQMLVIFH